VMLDRVSILRSPACGAGLVGAAAPWTAERGTMAGGGFNDDHDRTRRFRDAALPYLDDVYALARHLMRNTADAG
jgi:hypothetical protein